MTADAELSARILADAASATALPPGAAAEPQPPRPPWGRFCVLWICCSLASGLLPGQALFVKLFADAGVYSSVCGSEEPLHAHAARRLARHGEHADDEDEDADSAHARHRAERHGGEHQHSGHQPGGHGEKHRGDRQHDHHQHGHREHGHPHPGGQSGAQRRKSGGQPNEDDRDGDRAQEADAQAGCTPQMVTLTAIFSAGAGVATALLAPIGLFYDRWGARSVGVSGAGMCAAGLLLVCVSVVGAHRGLDATTSSAFTVGVLLCDFGSMLNSFSFMGLIWHFPGRQALVLTLINATYQVSAFLPLGFQLLMDHTGVGLGPIFLGYALVVLAATFVCWKLVPPQQEYYAQAKLVLGMPLPKPPQASEFWKMCKHACKVLMLHGRQHVASGFALSIGFGLPSFYGSFAAPYGEALFGDESDGTRLAELYVSVNGLAGLVLGPFFGTLADTFGLRVFMVFLAAIQLAATIACGIKSWIAQTICTLSLVLFNTLFTLFITRYLLLYSPPNRIGTVQGVYIMGVMVVAAPTMTASFVAVDLLPPGPWAYQLPMYVCGALGTAAVLAYAVYFHFNPPPDVPPLLPEDERELASNFGCCTLDEVMEVVHMQTRAQLIKAMSSTDPEAMHALVRAIDPEKMMEVMSRRSVEELAVLMEENDIAEDDEAQTPKDVGGQAADARSASVAKAGPVGAESPLLGENLEDQVHSPEADQRNDGPVERPEAPAQTGDLEAGDPRITALAAKLQRMATAKDKQGITDYMLKESIADMSAVEEYMDGAYTAEERKRMDKDFSAMISSAEFAKLLRQRPELRVLVQQSIKRDMSRKVAAFRRRGK